MLILSLIAAGTFSLFVSSHKIINEAGHRLHALCCAKMAAETLKVYVSADGNTPENASLVLANGVYDTDAEFANLGLSRSYINDGIIYNLSYNISDVIANGNATGLRRANIIVNWTEP